jgi:hypothetical protein
MRRVGRWLVRIAVTLSLVLAVATGVLWTRSHDGDDMLLLHRADADDPEVCYRFHGLGSSEGAVRIFSGSGSYLLEIWQSLLKSPNAVSPVPGTGWRLRPRRSSPISPAGIAKGAQESLEFAGVGRYRISFVVAPHQRHGVVVWLIPHSYLLTLFSLPPGLYLTLAARRGLRRRSRRRRGLCLDCGYDLRATPGRCPECGRGPATSEENTEPRIEHG